MPPFQRDRNPLMVGLNETASSMIRSEDTEENELVNVNPGKDGGNLSRQSTS